MRHSFFPRPFVWAVGGRWRGYRITRVLDGYAIYRRDGTYVDTEASLGMALSRARADEKGG